jgi:hypothetical protein
MKRRLRCWASSRGSAEIDLASHSSWWANAVREYSLHSLVDDTDEFFVQPAILRVNELAEQV